MFDDHEEGMQLVQLPISVEQRLIGKCVMKIHQFNVAYRGEVGSTNERRRDDQRDGRKIRTGEEFVAKRKDGLISARKDRVRSGTEQVGDCRLPHVGIHRSRFNRSRQQVNDGLNRRYTTGFADVRRNFRSNHRAHLRVVP